MNEILKMFRECGEIISGEMLTKDVEPKILFDAGGKVIATRDGADVSNLQEEDLVVMKMKKAADCRDRYSCYGLFSDLLL